MYDKLKVLECEEGRTSKEKYGFYTFRANVLSFKNKKDIDDFIFGFMAALQFYRTHEEAFIADLEKKSKTKFDTKAYVEKLEGWLVQPTGTEFPAGVIQTQVNTVGNEAIQWAVGDIPIMDDIQEGI